MKEIKREESNDLISIWWSIDAGGTAVGQASGVYGVPYDDYTFEPVENYDESDMSLYIERIDIDEQFRGKGYGTKAIQQISDEYRIVFAAPDNEDSQRLFERLGEEYYEDGAHAVDQGYGVYRV